MSLFDILGMHMDILAHIEVALRNVTGWNGSNIKLAGLNSFKRRTGQVNQTIVFDVSNGCNHNPFRLVESIKKTSNVFGIEL